MNDAVVPTHLAEPSLHTLYRDHRSWLESWLRRRLGNAWDAADLSQDTFLRVLASTQPIAQLQEPRADLVTVGKRLLVNFHQRRSLE
ncbi:MAG: sigma factor, partial [Pseudomonas sp.]